MKANKNFNAIVDDWKKNPRFETRNADHVCSFSEEKTSPFWCFNNIGWYDGGFATSFMFNHKDYVIQLTTETRGYVEDDDVLASAALPGKEGEEFADVYDLCKWMTDNTKGATKDEDIFFTLDETARPAKGVTNTTDKIILYGNPKYLKIILTITQMSPYRPLLRGEVPLTNDLDMTQVITPFISDEMFVIELITRAEAHYKKTKSTLVGFIGDAEDK